MKNGLLSSLALLEFLLVACGGGESTDTRPPDVLLVVLDTVRADRVSSYGYHRPTTPQIEALSESGVTFDNVFASGSWTYPNHASLFTGEYPWVHGAHFSPYGPREGDSFERANVTAVRKDLPMLAEKFSAAGYRTVAISSNTWLSKELGLVRGFDLVNIGADKETLELSAREIKAKHQEDKPLFLLVNIMIAHSPYCDGPGEFRLPDQSFLDPETAPEWLRPYLWQSDQVHVKGVEFELHRAEGDNLSGQERFLRGDLPVSEEDMTSIRLLYDSGVHIADFSLFYLLTAWSKRENESIIVVTSDHGEALGERGHIGHQVLVDPAILRVPLVIVAPNRIPQGIRIYEPVQWRDLHPTLLDLAGIEQREDSLVRLIQGQERPKTPILAKAWKRTDWVHMVGKRYRYDWYLYQTDDFALYWNGRDGEELQVEFYDVRLDATMQNNIADAHPNKVTELLSLAREAFADEVASEIQEISPELQEKLESLGYFVE